MNALIVEKYGVTHIACLKIQLRGNGQQVVMS